MPRKEDIVLMLTFIVALILFLWYVFGKSPTLEQVILGISMINMGWIYSLGTKLERHLGEHEGYQKAKDKTEVQKSEG